MAPDEDHAAAAAERTLFFLHVSGTGASRLRTMLESAYGEREVRFVYEQSDVAGAMTTDEYRHSPIRERGRFRLVMGSFPFGLHRGVPVPYRYTTLLRDPVDRVLSLHRCFVEHRLKGRPAMSLEDFVFGQQRLAVDNGMVRAIAGRQLVRWGQCPDDLLDEATEHIEEHFETLLVAEDMAASVEALERATGRSLETPTGIAPVMPSSLAEIDPSLLDRIRKLNVLDEQLYEMGRESRSIDDPGPAA